MGLCGMFNSLAFMLVFGLSMAGAVRVSHALGAGCPRGARRATQAVLALALAVLAVVCAALNVMQVRRGARARERKRDAGTCWRPCRPSVTPTSRP